MINLAKAEMRSSTRNRATIPCKITCSSTEALAQIVDISAGGAQIQVVNSPMADLAAENWSMALPGISALPFKIVWQAAPDYGVKFAIDQEKTQKLLKWIDIHFA